MSAAPSTRPLAEAAPLPTGEEVDLSVIIVSYNVRAFLEQALRSVCQARAGLRVEIFVVDNDSVDGSVEMVEEEFPHVTVIANRENVGFGRANNQAIRRARGRHLLILNPDTIVQENTLSTMVRFLDEHPEAGAAGCQILNPDGTFAPESRRAFPTPAVAFYRVSGLSRLFPNSRRFGRYNLTYLPVDAVAEVDALSGSCMFVRRAALYERGPRIPNAGLVDTGLEDADAEPEAPPSEIRNPPSAIQGAGLFDEDFFMYGEDLDWCFRIQAAGWGVYYTPATQIIHYKGESTKKGELRYVRLFYGAMLQFVDKHLQGQHSWLLALGLRLGIGLRAALSVAAGVGRLVGAPLADAGLVYALVAAIGVVRSWAAGSAVAPLFWLTVPALYAAAAVAGVAAAGGYRRRRRSLRPALVGAAAGFAGTAALSFFIKAIAFSRVTMLVALPATALALALRRLAHSAERGPGQALVVGRPGEAARLADMLRAHPDPPFRLAGFVSDEPEGERDRNGSADASEAPPYLGPVRHLRDLVRLRSIDTVVFATDGLAHHVVFDLVRRLGGLPVQFKMLTRGGEHLIGKASIEHLTLPALVALEDVPGRSRLSRRAFEVPAALLGLVLLPVAWLVSRRLGGASLLPRLQRLPAVLSGRLALVGAQASDHAAGLSPAEAVREGVFTIPEAYGAHTPDARRRAYTYYTRHQSAALDAEIIARILRRLPPTDPR